MRPVFLVLLSAWLIPVLASESMVSEPGDDSYNYVSHYRVAIEASPDIVWEHLTALGSWMYDFEMSHVSGKPGEVGEVLRLYPGQDFFTQIVSAVPGELLAVANLPAQFGGESSTGISVITLNDSAGHTIVDLTMSRRYTWQGAGDNTLRATRESEEFIQNSRSMWGRFLERLQILSESP